jgi:hypothetical protein
MHRFVALNIANANDAHTHPVTSLNGFPTSMSKSFMTEFASRARTPSIEVTKGVKDACLASKASRYSFSSRSQLIGEQNQQYG